MATTAAEVMSAMEVASARESMATAEVATPDAAVAHGSTDENALLEVPTKMPWLPGSMIMEPAERAEHDKREGGHAFRATRLGLPYMFGTLGQLIAGPCPAAFSSSEAENRAVMRALVGGARVRCFVSLLCPPEVERMGGAYQENVQQALDEVEPEAPPLPCALANVEDCLVGVVRWRRSLQRLGQCATFVLAQLRLGQHVYMHCVDGVGRTSIVSAVVLGVLFGVPAADAIKLAEHAFMLRQPPSGAHKDKDALPPMLTEEQRVLTTELLTTMRAEAAVAAASGEPAPAAKQAAAKAPPHKPKLSMSAQQTMAVGQATRGPAPTPAPAPAGGKVPVAKKAPRPKLTMSAPHPMSIN